MLLVETSYLLVADLTLDAAGWLNALAALGFIAFCGMVAQRYALTRLAGIMQGLALPVIIGALTVIGSVILARHSAALADAELAAADRALRFDWMALYRQYQAEPALVDASRWIYTSMHVQLPLLTLALFASRDATRGWTFITAWWVTSVITLAIFPFFPAAGPFVLNGIEPGDLPNLLRDFPWTTGPTIEGLRSGAITEASRALAGLVSFPSFHTAAGVLFAWAAWPYRWLRWPLLTLNLAMIASTLVSGAHYLIDLVGGVAVASAAIAISTRVVRNRTPLALPQDMAAEPAV